MVTAESCKPGHWFSGRFLAAFVAKGWYEPADLLNVPPSAMELSDLVFGAGGARPQLFHISAGLLRLLANEAPGEPGEPGEPTEPTGPGEPGARALTPALVLDAAVRTPQRPEAPTDAQRSGVASSGRLSAHQDATLALFQQQTLPSIARSKKKSLFSMSLIDRRARRTRPPSPRCGVGDGGLARSSNNPAARVVLYSKSSSRQTCGPHASFSFFVPPLPRRLVMGRAETSGGRAR